MFPTQSLHTHFPEWNDPPTSILDIVHCIVHGTLHSIVGGEVASYMANNAEKGIGVRIIFISKAVTIINPFHKSNKQLLLESVNCLARMIIIVGKNVFLEYFKFQMSILTCFLKIRAITGICQ